MNLSRVSKAITLCSQSGDAHTGNPRFGEKGGEPMIDMGCCQYTQPGLLMLVK